MKFSLISFTILIPFVLSIFERELKGKKTWEDRQRTHRLMKDPNWGKYHPTQEERKIMPDELAARLYGVKHIDHWNDHKHDHDHTHKHLQEHEHSHNQTHLHVEEHDHTHEHSHTHKHNHLHGHANNHTHGHDHEHSHAHKHQQEDEYHKHGHDEYYSKRRRLSGGDDYAKDQSNYKKYRNHKYDKHHETKPYYKKKSPKKYYSQEKPDEQPKYKLNLPTYHSEKENYSLNQQEYHSEKQPTAIPSESIKDYHMKSVENYIGDSGKEFEGAAEKIVEGYMGEYMDKYMNEWYVKYCKDTGKYCDQIKVVPINNNELDSTKNKNYQSYEKTQQEQYYPSSTNYHQNHFDSSQKDVFTNKAIQDQIYNNYEKSESLVNYNKYPNSDIQKMIEKDKYIHNNVPQNHYGLSQTMGTHSDVKFSPSSYGTNNFNPTYNPGFSGNTQQNTKKTRKERKRRVRNQNRNKRNKKTSYRPVQDPYMNFDHIEDMFAGNLFDDVSIQEKPLPYNKYKGYSAIEETDIDTVDRSYRPRYYN